MAGLEKALEGTDIEAIGTACRELVSKLNGLASHLSDMDMKAAEAARKAGTTAPKAKMGLLQPAIEAGDATIRAVVNKDIPGVKELLPQIKSSVDAARGALK